MTSDQPSIMSSVLYFVGVYLLLALILNVVLWALEKYAGFTMDTNAIGALPFIVAAMQSGQRYGMAVGAKPPSGYSWTASFLFLVVSIIISMAVLYGMVSYYGYQPMELVTIGLADLKRQGITGPIIGAVLGGIALLLWLAARFGFSFGAGNGVKMAARIAAKQGR
jgi:hypothetical protein